MFIINFIKSFIKSYFNKIGIYYGHVFFGVPYFRYLTIIKKGKMFIFI